MDIATSEIIETNDRFIYVFLYAIAVKPEL